MVFCTVFASAQLPNYDSIPNSIGQQMLNSNKSKGLSIGGYGQIDYNQPINTDKAGNLGKLDVHRLVMMFGYKFNKKTNFITELEIEHVSEIYVEQAFLSYRLNKFINFRGGLMLVPMGIVNEYHEPTTFNGVERPDVDKYIVPSTWREIGAGFSGNIPEATLRYQVYLMNGFLGHEDDKAKFSGKSGLRGGRQKGAESTMSSPSLSMKIDHYGIKGLRLGASYYNGKSQTTLFEGVDNNDVEAIARADSSVINIEMIGLDARYYHKGVQLRGQFITGNFKNTEQYNALFDSDLGKAVQGYYLEAAYDLLRSQKGVQQLFPFIRYENFNTHHEVSTETTQNNNYHRKIITTGLSYKITPGAVLKVDYQRGLNSKTDKINAGVGVWF